MYDSLNNDVSLCEFQLSGQESVIKISDFLDKVVLIVNTASECDFAGQLKSLEMLYQTYKDKGFIVVAVPCNDFGSKEPNEDDKIVKIYHENYKVNFPITKKYFIKENNNSYFFYQKAFHILGSNKSPKGNFHKYIINKEGQLVDYFSSTTAPDSKRIIATIENLLQEKKSNISEHLNENSLNELQKLEDQKSLSELINSNIEPQINIDINK